jgi:hypothetical protein
MYIREFVLRDNLKVPVSVLISDYEFIRDNPTEENILQRIKGTYGFIEFVGSPTYNVQLEAVKDYPYHIKYIKNPHIDIQKIVVRYKADSIFYIDNPDDEVQLICVEQHWGNIHYIKNPSEKIQIHAVRNMNFEKDNLDQMNRLFLVKRKITCKKAIELYKKLSKVSKIIV